MRVLLFVIAGVLLLQLAQGQKELAGAYIQGSDWCPDAAKQKQATPATTTERSGTLSRIFSRSDSKKKEQAPASAPACRMPFKLCGSVKQVIEKCKTTFGCRAISYDGRCGLLKTSEGPRTARKGWSTYVVA